MNTAPNDISLTNTDIPLAKAFNMRIKNKLSYKQIADSLNVPKTTLYEALKPLLNLVENDQLSLAYADNRAEILNNVEFALVCDLANQEKREKASLNNTAYALAQVNKMRLLESGQATENIQLADVSDAIDQARQRRMELAARLDELTGSVDE